MDLEKRIFDADEHNFNELALSVFKFQYEHNKIYGQYCDLLKIKPSRVQHFTQIPFLPIQFFKTHKVTATSFEPQVVFESSGTTLSINSKHYVKDVDLYKNSFIQAFEQFYGDIGQYCILGLLPSYLERENSSLVMMVKELIGRSANNLSGFYLSDFKKLHNTILHNEIKGQLTLLIGVTYALLDFAENYPMDLTHTTVMETGGMKGKREELTRAEVHNILQKNLGISVVHSEYGMTELLSQAYSSGNGIFNCPAWMKIVLREEHDPFAVKASTDIINKPVTGLINIIDLCNLYSCSFIATDDIGRLHPDGSFEVLGRMDNSDMRGCSLMAI
ncbi:MAG: acyl transferase [Chitinophagaceae bacterium]|nr:acyl transferase [Chitinophagaceae bacterium]